ncbi:hypothetical protein Tco_0957268 [Tanacetum coccineum]
MKRNVRDGRTTRFWKDRWMGDTTFQHQFPLLFRLEVNQDCMVRDRWNGGWNWIWSRPISDGNTSTQLSTLNTLIDPIILSESPDEWVWLLDPNNEFSVKKTFTYSKGYETDASCYLWCGVVDFLELSKQSRLQQSSNGLK